MTKSKCIHKNFIARSNKIIEAFINECLSKYEVTQIIETPFVANGVTFMGVTIIYNEEVIDDNDKELLKEIIKLDTISINNAISKFSIGYNRGYQLIKQLESLNIISSKEDGRKLLIDIDTANNIIDSYNN